jgi:hypothetical protein
MFEVAGKPFLKSGELGPVSSKPYAEEANVGFGLSLFDSHFVTSPDESIVDPVLTSSKDTTS